MNEAGSARAGISRMLTEETECLENMVLASQRSGRAVPRFVTRQQGVEAAIVTIRAAEKVTDKKESATVHVQVNGFGMEEARQVLMLQSFLVALSEGKKMLDAYNLTIGLIAPVRSSDEALEAFPTLLGKLPSLARILTGEAEGVRG